MAEGANPLCGDRIRIQLLVNEGTITDARFTADACALCIASASLLTQHVRGAAVTAAQRVDMVWMSESLGGEPPVGRRKCAALPLDTMRRGAAS
jgi:nitrogen fixation NifU-like protein